MKSLNSSSILSSTLTVILFLNLFSFVLSVNSLPSGYVQVSQPIIAGGDPLHNVVNDILSVGGIYAYCPDHGYLTSGNAIDHYIEIFHFANNSPTGITFDLLYEYYPPEYSNPAFHLWYNTEINISSLMPGVYYFKAFFSDTTHTGNSGEPTTFRNVFYRNTSHLGYNTNWPVNLNSGGSTNSEASIGDINLDGIDDIVIVTYSEGLGKNSTLHVLDANGSELEGFPVTFPEPKILSSFYPSPTLVDLNGDGTLEIIVNMANGQICAWYNNGTRVDGFPIDTGYYSINSVLAVDSNYDGKGEIYFLSGSYDCNLWGINSRGDNLTGFPVEFEGYCDYCNIAAADLQGDGDIEVLVGVNDSVYAFNNDGTIEFTTNTLANMQSSATLLVGDLDNNDDLEIIIPLDTFILILNHDGSIYGNFTLPNNYQEPYHTILADRDFDGDLEIYFFCYSKDIWKPLWPPGSSLQFNRFLGFDYTGNIVFDLDMPGQPLKSVTCADFNMDGKIEFGIPSLYGTTLFMNQTGYFNPDLCFTLPDWLSSMIIPTDLNHDGEMELLLNSNSGIVGITSMLNNNYNRSLLQWIYNQHDNKNTNYYGDLVPPTIIISENTTDGLIFGFIYDEFGIVNQAELRMNNILLSSFEVSPTGFFMVQVSLPNGNYELEIRAIDNSGNVAISQKSILIETTSTSSQTTTDTLSTTSTASQTTTENPSPNPPKTENLFVAIIIVIGIYIGIKKIRT
ncbi:MAG: FG-GAP repeat domain-containing protein [Candidatus Hodarchaeales archaeon]